jgi:energy-coupling factor transport system permease protein
MIGFRYQEKGTLVHQLSPLTKLAWGGGILVLSLIFNHPLYILLLFLATLPLVISARIGREWASAMRLSLYLGASIVLINVLVSYHGSHVLVEAPFQLPVLGTPVITLEAIFFGVMMSLRLVVIISVFTLLTLTIHPDDIMSALLKLRFPYKSVLVTSLSTRFVPCLLEDIERISEVHKSRGLELDKGNWLQKVKNRIVITIPLLANSLDRAVQVAEAMESRAFGTGQGRTFYKEIRMTRMDIVTLVLGILPCAWGISIRLWGYGDYQYYPTLGAINIGSLEWLILSIMVLLLVSILPLAFAQRRLFSNLSP